MDHCREFFLDCDGLTYQYETGHWYKVECREVRRTPRRPAGLKYSLAFFSSAGVCLVRYDNSHAAKDRGRRQDLPYDHWHRFARDETVPYEFQDVERLLSDFFADIDRQLPPHLRSG